MLCKMYPHVRVTVYALLFCHCLLTAAATFKNAVPPGWEPMCQAYENSDIMNHYLPEFKSHDGVVYLKCQVSPSSGGSWQFSTLRDHLHQVSNLSVFLQVECIGGSQISLPWPMKAQGVIGVSVRNCILTDKYADLWNPIVSHVKSGLKVLEIRHSSWLSNLASFNNMKNSLSNVTRDYDCGHASTIEYMVTNNVSDIMDPMDLKTYGSGNIFKNLNLPVDSGITDAHVHEANSSLQSYRAYTHRLSPVATTSESTTTDDIFAKLGAINVHKCSFAKLRVLEESYPSLMIVNYFKLLVYTNSYPELRALNFSRSGIKDMPTELVNFRKHFPKLQHIDLSRNNMTEVTLPIQLGPNDQLTLNISYNKITRLTMNDLNDVSQIEGLFLDFRGNPIHCGCYMADLLLKMKSANFFSGKLEPYSYVKDMECASPFHLAGRRLSSLVVMMSPVDVRCNVDKQNHSAVQGGIRTSRLWAALVCTTTTGPLCNIV